MSARRGPLASLSQSLEAAVIQERCGSRTPTGLGSTRLLTPSAGSSSSWAARIASSLAQAAGALFHEPSLSSRGALESLTRKHRIDASSLYCLSLASDHSRTNVKTCHEFTAPLPEAALPRNFGTLRRRDHGVDSAQHVRATALPSVISGIDWKVRALGRGPQSAARRLATHQSPQPEPWRCGHVNVAHALHERL